MSRCLRDFLALIIIIAAMIVIGLCAGCTVTSSEWARADKYCESRGGVKAVYTNQIGVCNYGHSITVSAYND